MKKLKISAAPVLKFLRELSVIVTGIIITVGLGFWVNSINNKNDLKLNLDTIVIELEENAKTFDRYAKWMQKSVRYSEYIQSNDKNALNQDSLEYYSGSSGFYESDNIDYGCGYLNVNSLVNYFTTNAFEMLKSSGTMRQVKDKKLLLSIWEAYTQIEYTKNLISFGFQEKAAEFVRDELSLAEGKQVTVPMQMFYKYETPFAIVMSCRETSQAIRRALSKLKESKLVK